ncbi:MAG: PQQ-dependent sugar dehydrogenase [Steroidobacteraceae bacterium]
MNRRVIAFVLLWTVLSHPNVGLSQQTTFGIAPISMTKREYVFDTAEQHKIRVVVLAKGLKHPFSVALLPQGDALVSERSGALRLIHDADGVRGKSSKLDPEPVTGLPQLDPVFPHGGLHDVILHPQFSQNRYVYFTFNKPGSMAAPGAKPSMRREAIVSLMRGRLSVSGKTLTDVVELFSGESGSVSGSRIAFGKEGLIYLTTGSPFGNQPQHLDSVYGKVLRLRDDGTIPEDNPFVGQAGIRPEIFAFGGRDQLGIAVDPATGAILATDHGPNGGDEVNLILPGRNYGWPIVSFGRHYEGPRWSESPVAEGVEQPLVVWLPSIAPSGLAFYNGNRFPAWKGNLFVASARRGEILRTGGLERVVFNEQLEELRRETLLMDLHQRIRDVRQGPDGLLYVLTDEEDGALLRIEPVS